MGAAEAANIQSGNRECFKSLIQATHHDARLVVPVPEVAFIGEKRRNVPGQHGEAHGPERREEGVDQGAEARAESAVVVEEGGHEDGNVGE